MVLDKISMICYVFLRLAASLFHWYFMFFYELLKKFQIVAVTVDGNIIVGLSLDVYEIIIDLI